MPLRALAQSARHIITLCGNCGTAVLILHDPD